MRKVKSESKLFGLVRIPGLKHSSSTHGNGNATIGVLAFEVASLMSKTVHLWHSLSDHQITQLCDEVLHLEGVHRLISDDDQFLLGLVVAEITESLGFLSRSVDRLGKRCSDPVLHRFRELFMDLVKTGSDPYGMCYANWKMEKKVKKMEKLIGATSNLHQELDVLAELEQGLCRLQLQSRANADQTSVIEFKQKVLWQRQEVKYIRANSLWNCTYDYTFRLLARALFAIVARIKHVFRLEQRDSVVGGKSKPTKRLSRSQSSLVPGVPDVSVHPSDKFSSGPLVAKSGPILTTRNMSASLPPSHKNQTLKTSKWVVIGRPFNGCMAGGGNSPVMHSCIPLEAGYQSSNTTHITSTLEKSEIVHSGSLVSMFDLRNNNNYPKAPDSTLGAAALALHYANLIIVIEKLAVSPHLIGSDAREDLYNMLTASIRAALRGRLKTYAKNLTSSVYDPKLASDWTEAIGRILDWLAPLAHNMIRWQSERNFEQKHVVSTTNVLLLQTLYFANQAKTEAAITELLVGLNYLWRYARELNDKAILECVSSRDYNDCFSPR
ncbi:hypothetical protein LUZ63_017489 [Rhynchospora breviuscula]|uniref:Uncharacterized protein n=1 Tax=Rhynchospora breviuscula TaxID=2022672 RepID=A0A9Q0HGB1_9POAL|nr:hypothetical protein LUZ63_017489 [Rhynchospora breviuscula]